MFETAEQARTAAQRYVDKMGSATAVPSFPNPQIGVHETLEDLAVIGSKPMKQLVDNHELAQLLGSHKSITP